LNAYKTENRASRARHKEEGQSYKIGRKTQAERGEWKRKGKEREGEKERKKRGEPSSSDSAITRRVPKIDQTIRREEKPHSERDEPRMLESRD
jgi:hypothetical protein